MGSLKTILHHCPMNLAFGNPSGYPLGVQWRVYKVSNYMSTIRQHIAHTPRWESSPLCTTRWRN